MWKYKGAELGLDGITGIPAHDMTDEEFAEASAKHALVFGDFKALANSGLWEHESDSPKSSSRASRKAAEDEEVSDGQASDNGS